MAVKIRMKMMGRKHRPFFRICAVDSRNPRDGRVLEELGTYDPMVPDTDARALLKGGADQLLAGRGRPAVGQGEGVDQEVRHQRHARQRAAGRRERLAMPKIVPDAGEPVYVPQDEAAAAAEPAEAPAASESAAADVAAVASSSGEEEAPSERPKASE